MFSNLILEGWSKRCARAQEVVTCWMAIIKKNIRGYLLREVEAVCMCSFIWFWLLIPVRDKKSVVLDSVIIQEKYIHFHTDLQLCTTDIVCTLIWQRRDLFWYLGTWTEEDIFMSSVEWSTCRFSQCLVLTAVKGNYGREMLKSSEENLPRREMTAAWHSRSKQSFED